MSKLTNKKRQAFLAALEAGCSVYAAAQATGLTRQAFYKARLTDSAFAEAWDDAVDAGSDALEDEAIRRARAGSDVLLIFMLKARRPEMYRERYEVKNTGASKIEVVYVEQGGGEDNST